ncbi:MAG: hypothetical protein JW936_03695 [Sedimentisphaerales bacterium]|nr:hypothetical protein [Sedimentisphaerales bacterium]
MRCRLLMVCLAFFFCQIHSQTFCQSLSGTWEYRGQANWCARDSMGEVVYDGRMWIFGGFIPSRINDVWSSANGVNWTLETSAAGWSGRNLPCSLVYDDKMWIIGGFSGPTATLQSMNDVWCSTNGQDWTHVADAPWSGRGALAGCVYNGKMWIMGGFEFGSYIHHNDVWYSTDGITWTQATAAADWAPRGMMGCMVFDDKMWIYGGGEYNTAYSGNTKTDYADVWYSTDGVNWTQATANAGWTPRRFHGSVVYDDKMWIIGGYHFGNRNDVWCSSDGVNWTELIPNGLVWTNRHESGCLVFDDKIWVVGGYANDSLKNEIWTYSSVHSELPDSDLSGIVEDFGTDPTARSWVDTSATNFDYGPGLYVSGSNVREHVVEGYYRPLGRSYTQDDFFWATFDAGYNSTVVSQQELRIGFFNQNDWFVADPSPINAVCMWLYNGWAPEYSARANANIVTDNRTLLVGTAWNPAPRDVFVSHLLVYTPGSGANGAGQLQLTAYNLGDYGGAAIYASVVDLYAGDTFTVDSFGVFTGHRSENNTDGLYFWMNRVETIAEPGDADGNGLVDLRDFVNLANNWLRSDPATIGHSQGDFSHNGVVDLQDVCILAAYWLQ